MSQKMKIVAAKEAIKSVKNNMNLGLGTGSTVDEFLKLLSFEIKNGLNIDGEMKGFTPTHVKMKTKKISVYN